MVSGTLSSDRRSAGDLRRLLAGREQHQAKLGCGKHREDEFDAIAEARFKPHRRNRMAPPVHPQAPITGTPITTGWKANASAR